MAEIVIGIGTSHSPQLSVRAADWQVLREKDETDPRLDYKKLLEKAKPGLDAELTPEKFRQRDEACQAAIKVCSCGAAFRIAPRGLERRRAPRLGGDGARV